MSGSIMSIAVKSPSAIPTLLLFMVFVPFNAEILTDSNPIELFVLDPVVGGLSFPWNW
jgi:hypothetical protein